jgi:undecaprenyl-diphosphatase
MFDRARPEDAIATGLAYPSGHSTFAMAVYGLVAVLVAPAAMRRGAPRWVGPLAVGVWLGLAAGVGIARVAAGVHWPLDVLGGWALGGAVVAAAWWARAPPRKADAEPPSEDLTQPAL